MNSLVSRIGSPEGDPGIRNGLDWRKVDEIAQKVRSFYIQSELGRDLLHKFSLFPGPRKWENLHKSFRNSQFGLPDHFAMHSAAGIVDGRSWTGVGLSPIVDRHLRIQAVGMGFTIPADDFFPSDFVSGAIVWPNNQDQVLTAYKSVSTRLMKLLAITDAPLSARAIYGGGLTKKSFIQDYSLNLRRLLLENKQLLWRGTVGQLFSLNAGYPRRTLAKEVTIHGGTIDVNEPATTVLYHLHDYMAQKYAVGLNSMARDLQMISNLISVDKQIVEPLLMTWPAAALIHFDMAIREPLEKLLSPANVMPWFYD